MGRHTLGWISGIWILAAIPAAEAGSGSVLAAQTRPEVSYERAHTDGKCIETSVWPYTFSFAKGWHRPVTRRLVDCPSYMRVMTASVAQPPRAPDPLPMPRAAQASSTGPVSSQRAQRPSPSKAPAAPVVPSCVRDVKPASDEVALKLAQQSIAKLRVLPAEKLPELTAGIKERAEKGSPEERLAYAKALKGAEKAIARLRDPKTKVAVVQGTLTLRDAEGKVFFSSAKFGRGVGQYQLQVPNNERFSDILIFRGAADLTDNQGTRDLLAALDLADTVQTASGKAPMTPTGAREIEMLVADMNSSIPECNYFDVSEKFVGDVRRKLDLFVAEPRQLAAGGGGEPSQLAGAAGGGH